MAADQPSPLGALLVQTRKRAGLTQEGLAEQAGVSVNTIGNLEAGRGHLPRQATLNLLVTALGGALALAGAEQRELQAAFRATVRAARAQRLPPAPEDAVSPSAAASPPLPSGTLTFLVCASAPATHPQAEQPQAVQAVVTRLATLLQRVVPAQGGRLVDPPHGPDGAVCVFTRVDQAMTAARALQQALWEQTSPGRTGDGAGLAPLPLCLALHTGGAEPGVGDYAGPTRWQAARLARLGHGGQLLLSTRTRDLIGRRLPEGARLQEVGRQALSVVERPRPLYQLLPALQPAAFPPLRTLPRPLSNLPVQLTSFIGREREQATVSALLGQAPLVTLVGAGGCGKTRLALAVAAEALEQYPDGVWLVELAALADPALVPQAVATALRLREEAGRSLLTTLCEYLAARQALLVLDNCEHLLPACAELAAALLRRCLRVQVLATSRERLGIGGESGYRVPSLALPPAEQAPTPAALLAYEGVRLFVERARACQPDFGLSEENAAVVARICARLDGLPLAIELAAARVGSLTVEGIAARLDDCFRLLTGGGRDVLPRQRTLRAALDWSYGLLTEQEQRLLDRLAVFAGGWTLAAAAAICAGEGVDHERLGGSNDLAYVAKWEVLDLLTSLVNKSLVQAEERDGGELRYGLLETVRQYGQERLAAAGDTPAVRDRHLGYFLALAEQAEPALRGPEQGTWLTRLETEHDNLRAALSWTRERGATEEGLRLAAALWHFWNRHGHLSEGRAWLEAALAGDDRGTPRARARALNGAGNLAYYQGNPARAAALYEEALALRRALGDRQGMAGSLGNLGNVAHDQGDLARAATLYEESLALKRELGDTWGSANTLGNLGLVALHQGDYGRAAALSEEALGLYRELGDTWGIAASLDNLGLVALHQGDHGRAAALSEEALGLSRELGDTWGIAASLGKLGLVALHQGDHGRAAQLCGAAEALREVLGVPLPPDERAGHDQAVQAMRAALGEEAFAAAWAEGRALSLEQAIALALA